MALAPGTRCGAYEITGLIGAGGMGEVYRARDIKLKRDVAIKVLPSDVAADLERLARFQREAEVLASLNHPHIAHVYGLENPPEGGHHIVMELVEGEDLSQRIARGPIPIDEALPIAKQIAEALEAAHEAGIIHRDLKPANIKVRDDGTVKVLDFGLAKALEPGAGIREPGSGQALANSPTITSPAMTMRGVILGTAAYMSPEQAKGKFLDRRTDIWAFGCVLYEMLTGMRAFRGEDVTDTIAEVLKSNVDFGPLPASTPAAIRRLIERCVERDPRARLRDIGEARIVLQNPGDGSMATRATPRRGAFYAAAVLVLAGIGIAGAAAWTMRRAEPAPARPVIRVSWPYAQGRSLRLVVQREQLTISRNGRVMATLGDNVWIRPMNQLNWTAAPGTADATAVFASPDGEWIGFLTRQGIGKIRSTGNTASTVVSVASASRGLIGGAWGDDDRIYFTNEVGIHAVSANGGLVEKIVEAADVGTVEVLPGGSGVLYSMGRSTNPAVMLHTFDGQADTLLAEGLSPRFVPPDLLLFLNGTTLSGASIDLAARRLRAAPVTLLEGVAILSVFGQYDVSEDGTLVYVPSASVGQPTSILAQLTKVGDLRTLHSTERQYSDPRLSPDGRRLALHLSDHDNDIWVFDLDRGALTRVTFDRDEDETPAWSPDGQWVAFSGRARNSDARSVFRRRADGSGNEDVLWTGLEHTHVTDWSPDGRLLLLEANHVQSRSDVLALDLADKTIKPLMQSPFNEAGARLSPDGRWIAYQSDESGRFEIYVRSFPSLDRKIQVSTKGGVQPVWARDGSAIYFRTESTIEWARLQVAGGDPRAAAPTKLFDDKFVRPQGVTHTTYDVAADGSLIVFQPPPRSSALSVQTEIVGVFNWLEEVRQKLRAP